MNEIKYYAKIRRENGSEYEYEVLTIDENLKIIEALNAGDITSQNICGIIYDYDNSFYHKNHCNLVVNSLWVPDEKELYKSGFVKVVGLRKEVIGIIEETQIF